MTIQDLGSVGELIAAVATVATLVYLAVQIRQNTRALGHASESAMLDYGNSWRNNLIQNPEITELYRKGLLDPNALDPIEKLRFRMLLDGLFMTWLYIFRGGQLPGYNIDPHIRGTYPSLYRVVSRRQTSHRSADQSSDGT